MDAEKYSKQIEVLTEFQKSVVDTVVDILRETPHPDTLCDKYYSNVEKAKLDAVRKELQDKYGDFDGKLEEYAFVEYLTLKILEDFENE